MLRHGGRWRCDGIRWMLRRIERSDGCRGAALLEGSLRVSDARLLGDGWSGFRLRRCRRSKRHIDGAVAVPDARARRECREPSESVHRHGRVARGTPVRGRLLRGRSPQPSCSGDGPLRGDSPQG